MPDFKNGFSIDIKYDGRTEKQNFSMAKGDDALCLYEQNSDNAVMMLEPQKREFTIDNSTHRFDAISKEDIIILKDVSNIQVQYNTDFTITTDTEKGKRTFKISHHEVSVKIGTSFEPVATFNQPLDVTLPESLPAQISNGNIKMNSFPAQMTNMLVNDYNYQTLTLKNGLCVLKSPDGEILYQDGTKLSTSNVADVVRAPSGLVLRFLPITEIPKMAENRVRKGTRISEEDAKAFSEFANQPLDLNNIPALASDASYTRLTKSSSAYRIGKEETETQTEAQAETQTEAQAEAQEQITDMDYKYTPTANDSNLNSEYFTGNTSPWEDYQYTTDFGINANRNQNENSTENATTTEETQENNTAEQPVNSTENSTENTAEKSSENHDGDSGDEGSNPTQSDQPKPENSNNTSDNSGFTAGSGKPNEKGNNPVSPQNENSEKKEVNGNKKDIDKEQDEKNKKTADKAKSAAIQKGIRIVLFIAAANLFMAAFMLANPLFALLATMCVAGMATSLVAQSLLPAGTFSSMFSIGKDIKDWWHAKEAIKELTPRQKRILKKYQEKVANGEPLSRFKWLEKRRQKKLERLNTRANENLSNAEYKAKIKAERVTEKSIQELPSFHKLNDLKNVAEKQNEDFKASKNEAIEKLNKEIAAREKFLEVEQDKLSNEQKDMIQNDIDALKEYGNKLNNFENPVYKSNQENLNLTENELRDDIAKKQEAGQKPNLWLEHEPEIDDSKYDDIIKKNGLEQPGVSLDIGQLKALEAEISNREEQNQQTEEIKKIEQKTEETTKKDDGPTFTPTII